MTNSDHNRRLLAAAAGALLLVGGGIAVGTFALDGDPSGVAATASARSGDPAPVATSDDYSLRDVTCGTNLFDNPVARGKLVNIADDNRQLRVSVVFRDGDKEVGHGMEILDELTPGESGSWVVYLEKEFTGGGLDCDVRVEEYTPSGARLRR